MGWFDGRLGRARPALVAAVVLVSVTIAGVAVVAGETAPQAQLVAGGSASLAQFAAPSGAADDSVPETVSASAPAPAQAGPGHRTPGAVVAPFEAGRTEWSGVSNGISLRMTISPAAPRAGEPVTFTVEGSTAGGLCCGFMIRFGDGGEGQFPPVPALGGDQRCLAREPKSNSTRGTITHTYNASGRWDFSFSARTGGICDPTGAVYGSLDGQLQVGAGTAAPTAQGPSQPTVRPASVWPYESRVITLSAEAQDDDGHIARLIVNWGDGSPTQTYTNPRECIATPSGWPAGSYTILPNWMGVGAVTHRYRDDAPHTVTVTAVSTACDGSAEQRGAGTLTFPEQPATSPPPSFPSTLPPPPLAPVTPPPPIGSCCVNLPPPGMAPVLSTTTTTPATRP